MLDVILYCEISKNEMFNKKITMPLLVWSSMILHCVDVLCMLVGILTSLC